MDHILAAIHSAIAKKNLEGLSPTRLVKQSTVGFNNNFTGFSPTKGTIVGDFNAAEPKQSVQLSSGLVNPSLFIQPVVQSNALPISSGIRQSIIPKSNSNSASIQVTTVGIQSDGGKALSTPTFSSATKSLANILEEMHKQQKRNNGRNYNSRQSGGRLNTATIPSLLNLNFNTKSINETSFRSQSSSYTNQNTFNSTSSTLGGGLGSNLGGGLGNSLGGRLSTNIGGGLQSNLGSGLGSSLGVGMRSSLGGGVGNSLAVDSMYGGSSMWQSDIRNQQQSLLGNPPIMSGGNRYGNSKYSGIREDDFAAKVRLQQAMLAQEGIGMGMRESIRYNNDRDQTRRGIRKRTSEEMYDPTRPTDDFDDSEPSRKRSSRDKKASTTSGPWRCNVCNIISSNLQEYKVHMDSQSHKNAINRIKMVANFQTDQAKARMQAQQHLRMIEGNRNKGGNIGHKGSYSGGSKASGASPKNNVESRGERHFCRECQIFFYGSTIDHRKTPSHQDSKKNALQSRRHCKICNITLKDNQKYQVHCNSERHRKEYKERQNKGSAKSEDFVTVDAIGIFEEEIDEGSEATEDTTKQQEPGKDNSNGSVLTPTPALLKEGNDHTETSEKLVEVVSSDALTEVDADSPADVVADSPTEINAGAVVEITADEAAEVNDNEAAKVNDNEAAKVNDNEAAKVNANIATEVNTSALHPNNKTAADVDNTSVPEPSFVHIPEDEHIVPDEVKINEPKSVNASSEDSKTASLEPVKSEPSKVEKNSHTFSEIPDFVSLTPVVVCKEKPKSGPNPVVPTPKITSRRPKRIKQTNDSTADSPNGSEPEDDELNEYDPNVPVGQSYVVPVSGYFCKLCHKFYLKKTVAKVTHCSSQPHFNAVKLHFSQKKKENAMTEAKHDEDS